MAPRKIRRAPIPTPTTIDTNVLARQVAQTSTETDRLTREEIDAYLTQKNRGAQSLITAFSLTRDTNFLYEAAEKYPKDPHVQLAVLAAKAFPEDRWRRLEAFKQSAPDNSLANHLTAREFFKTGQSEKALGEFTEARERSALNMYWLDGIQATAEAYISAGFAHADAYFMGFASSSAPLSLLSEFRLLSSDLSSLATQYRQTGNSVVADSLTTMGLTLGDRLAKDDTAKLLINEVVGYSIQMIMLQNLDPSAKVEFGGNTRTVTELLGSIQARRKAIHDLSRSVPLTDLIMSHAVSDDDIATYFEHLRTEGEFAALQWLHDKLGPNLPAQPQPVPSEQK